MSFAAIEGLGAPPEDEDGEEEKRGWFRFAPWGRA